MLLPIVLGEAPQGLGLASLSAVIQSQFPKIEFITIPELLAAQKSGGAIILLDTRSKDEFDVGHLRSARWIDPEGTDLLASLNNAPRTATIITYCSVGYRSASVADHLRKSGFVNLRNLERGIFGWGNDGLPMVDSTGRTTKLVHPYNLLWGQYLDRALWSKKPL